MMALSGSQQRCHTALVVAHGKLLQRLRSTNGVLQEMCSFEPETCTEPMEIQRRVQCNVCICIAVVLVDH